VITLVLDQASKAAVFANVRPGEELLLAPQLSILPSWNPGTAFGFAQGAAPQLLIALALGLSAWLVFLMINSRSLVEAAALGTTIGGALANVVDRFRFGAVRDFVDVHWNALHWPTFNAADIFVVGGLLVFAATDMHRQRNARRSSARQEPARRGHA
jgi:signal peptidase II